jgi:tetratricopeptide (TPR) repeat protein
VKRKYLLWFFIWVCIILGAFSCRKKSAPPKAQVAGGQEKGTAAVLAIGAEMRWQPVYVGDPLAVQVRIWSPRERQELYKKTLKTEQGQAPAASDFVPPKIADSWASLVALNLFKIDPAGKRISVLPAGAWEPYRVKPETGLSLAELGLASPSAAWVVSPDAAKLTEGQYILTVSWKGSPPDAGSRAGNNELKGEDLFFDVKSLTSDAEKAGHLGRLAYFEYRMGNYEQARRDGKAAVALDPENLFPERIETWFITANASIGLKDFKSAKETLTALLAKLPPPAASDIALAAKQLLDSLSETEKLP